MNKEETRGRKMRSDNVRVIPEFRDQIDIEKLCQALIEIAKSIAKDKKQIWTTANQIITKLKMSLLC